MQPRGAVIANTPLPTAWSFGTISSGSIGTFTSTIQNTGNGPATAKIQGLSLANVFGLQNNPTNVAPKSVAALVGQFTPPSTNGTWTDRGQLVVSAPAFCAGLPNQWITPYIDFSGSSNGNPSVTFSGNLVFPTTNCAAAPPAGQSVTLANATNQSLAYTVKFASGTWYTVTDSGAGSLAANGVATIVVNPKTVSPAQGVIAGSAPYGDDLLIAIATSPATKFTVPVSWTLNGAVLSLPKGAGPNTDAQGHAFYPADSTSGFSLAMDNAGTAAVGVDVAVQPSGAFVLQPAPPVQVLPNIRALPELVSAGSSPACPTTTHGTATFTYTGPVCQPFTLPVVNVYSCAGAF
jgi:hypothetical protein